MISMPNQLADPEKRRAVEYVRRALSHSPKNTTVSDEAINEAAERAMRSMPKSTAAAKASDR